MREIFTTEESALLIDCLNGFPFVTTWNPIIALHTRVCDYVNMTSAEKEGITLNTLSKKLLKLTAAQAYCVCACVTEYWNRYELGEEAPDVETLFLFH